MIAILSITFPIFAAIGLGYGTVRIGLFKKTDMRILGSYVINIALPALVLHSIATRSLSEVLNPGYLVVYLVGGLASIAVAYAWFSAQGLGPARRTIGAMGAGCSNSGYVGYPLLLIALPDLAGRVLAMNMVIENFIFLPVCLTALEMSRDRESKSLFKTIAALVLSLLKRPLIIALLLALAISVSGIQLPDAAQKLMSMLAASASALALFVIGGSLVGLPIKGNRALAAQIVAGKLLLHPALTMLALVALPLLGLPLVSPDLQMAVIVTAALPMMGIYPILAQDYGHEGIASIALLGATIGSFFTLSALLALFQ